MRNSFLIMLAIIALVVLQVVYPSENADAQDFSTGIAQLVAVADGEANDGAVVCSTPTGIVRCTTQYATNMFGVVTDNPAGYYDPSYGIQNPKYVLNSGVVAVQYVLGGELLRVGELVTSSETPGAVQRATESGFVLGSVVREADPQTGKVMVAIQIHPEAQLATTRSNLIAVLREGTKAPVLAPLDSLRYLIAALLIIASFVIGFIYFGRMANTGVEAIGRNPLAGKQIQFNMFLHIGVTIVIVISGLFLSYLVLIV